MPVETHDRTDEGAAQPAQPEPLVSVLTPVYNGARYLEQCVRSVHEQSYGNWRHVIVDNRSTDATAEVGRRMADLDDRVELVSCEEFLPVIGNWNRAFDHAIPGSAYVKFVHADDWLYPDCLARMVDVAERHPSVGVVGSYRLDGTKVNLDGLPIEREIFDGRELCRGIMLAQLPYLFGSPTSTLLRMDAITRRPLYEDSYLHADLELCYAMLRDSDFGFVHQVLTYTRRHREAVTSFAQRIGTNSPEGLRVLIDHGRHFLSQAEYERRLAVKAASYGRALARRPLGLREDRFRDYHRRALAEVVGAMDVRDLGRGIGRQLAKISRGERAGEWAPNGHPDEAVR